MKDENYARESQYKIVGEYVGRRSRAKQYMWTCKLCQQIFGPAALYNILQDRVGICCAHKAVKAERYKKYQSMEGSPVTSHKTLVKFVGETNDRHVHPLFIYKCNDCGKEFGPNQLQMIKFYDRSQCCLPGKYNVLGHGVISSARIKRQHAFAKRRNLDCDLTAEFLDNLWNTQEGCCTYTGLKIEHIDKASLDRIDSSKGYLMGNVQWVLREINTMKMDLSEERFLELCSLVVSRNGENNDRHKEPLVP